MNVWNEVATAAAIALVAIICAFALVIFWLILSNRIKLDGLIAEAGGKASLSRFQLLLFTFVIAGLYLLLSIESRTLIDIPNNVLGLLGISGGSYLISKGVQSGVDKAAMGQNQAPAAPPAPGGQGGQANS